MGKRPLSIGPCIKATRSAERLPMVQRQEGGWEPESAHTTLEEGSLRLKSR